MACRAKPDDVRAGSHRAGYPDRGILDDHAALDQHAQRRRSVKIKVRAGLPRATWKGR